MIFKKLYWSFTIIIIIGCTQDWDLPKPQFSSNINCIIEVNGKDTSYVQYTKVRTPGDSLRYDFINDASIAISSNNMLFNFTPQSYRVTYNYKSEIPLIADARQQLSLIITDPKYGKISSEEIVPARPILVTSSIADSLLKNISSNAKQPIYSFSGTLNLNTLNRHYLRLKIFMPNDYTLNHFGQPVEKEYASNMTIRPIDENEIKLYNNEFFMVDDPSKIYRFKISGSSRLSKNKLNYIVMKISSVNDAFFKYAMQVDETRKTGNSPFVEPLHIDTNIKNGYGIFGIQNTVIDTFYIR